MSRLIPRMAAGTLGTTLTAAMSLFLAVLAVVAFVVVRTAVRDQLTTVGFHTVWLLANDLRSRPAHGPGRLKEVVSSFEADGVESVTLIGPGPVVIATNAEQTPDRILEDPLLPEAFRMGDVQTGFSEGQTGEVFRVMVPLDRLPRPPWRRFGPMPRAGDAEPPWPPPELGAPPGRMIVVLDVLPEPTAWMWSWVYAQAAASGGAIVLLWLAWFGARRASSAIERLEAEQRRRETLARLGEMSAVLAHEVRNPLASLKGQLQLAVEEMRSDADQTRVQRRVKTALSETSRIESLVRGLLDYARDSRAQLAQVPAEGIVSLARALAGDTRDVEVQQDVPASLTLVADRDEMARAVGNLLRNAVEAAGTGGRVRVRAWADAAEAHIAVEDSGPGVPEDLARRLFDPFVTGKVRGVGLGLAVARKVVEAHGGRIVVARSQDLGGAHFEVVWPNSRRTRSE